MTDEWWVWVLATLGPIPLVWGWTWWRAHREARRVRAWMREREERRRRFGGAVKVPGTTKAERIER